MTDVVKKLQEILGEPTPKQTECVDREDTNSDVLKTPAAEFWLIIQKSMMERLPSVDLSSYEFSEDDTGRLFVDLLEDCFKYQKTDNVWKIFTGTHWMTDLWGLAGKAAEEVARIRQASLAYIPPSSIKEAASFVKRARSAAGNRAILYFSALDPRVSTSAEDYDTNADLTNTPEGTCDNREKIIREHRREDLITKITRYPVKPHHEPKYFKEFLHKICCGREDLKESLRLFCGSGASGRTPKDNLGIAQGGGAAGKSAFFGTIADVLGSYARPISMQTLQGDQRASGHTDDIASMTGVRFAVCGENNAGVRLDEGRAKSFTGGDRLTVSRKHGRSFEMTPQFTLLIHTNAKPRIHGRDSGIWRRIKLFPFDWTCPESERDLDFKKKMLEADGPYIMAWIMSGCWDWMDKGFGDFKTTHDATEKYRNDEDVIGTFLKEICILDNAYETNASALRTAYEDWARSNGEHVFGGRAWREALEEHGLRRAKIARGHVWRGVSLKSEDSQGDFFQ